MIEVGRLCIKLAGRDANRNCVVVEIIDNKNVIIDGDVRRKKCNITHLIPLDKTVELKTGSNEEVAKAFEEMGLKVWKTTPKKAGEKPTKQRKAKEKVVKKVKKSAEKAEKKTTKKATKKTTKKATKKVAEKVDAKKEE